MRAPAILPDFEARKKNPEKNPKALDTAAEEHYTLYVMVNYYQTRRNEMTLKSKLRSEISYWHLKTCEVYLKSHWKQESSTLRRES